MALIPDLPISEPMEPRFEAEDDSLLDDTFALRTAGKEDA
jgi:hypothetical protein